MRRRGQQDGVLDEGFSGQQIFHCTNTRRISAASQLSSRILPGQTPGPESLASPLTAHRLLSLVGEVERDTGDADAEAPQGLDLSETQRSKVPRIPRSKTFKELHQIAGQEEAHSKTLMDWSSEMRGIASRHI